MAKKSGAKCWSNPFILKGYPFKNEHNIFFLCVGRVFTAIISQQPIAYAMPTCKGVTH